MIKNLISAILLALLICPEISLAAPDRVTDFALLDYFGDFHQLSRYLDKEALVLMSYDENCMTAESDIERFLLLELEYRNKDLAFVLIDSLDIGRNDFNAEDFTLPVLEDTGQLVSESLGVTRAGEVLVLIPRRTSLLYQGPLGEDLDKVLVDLVEGNPAEESLRRVGTGCEISYPALESHKTQIPDYASEIAPLIVENCTECHRHDGVGPFAMDSHIMLMGWSPMIREVLINKRMPPTQIDPYIGHSDSARYISTPDLQAIIHWIDAGAPRGNSEFDPLENLDFSKMSHWELGEPDFIVKGPPNDVPPTGVLDYIYADIELPFEGDRWINAIQYLAGDESVLHHLMTFVTAPGESFWGRESEIASVTRRFVGGYAPGDNKGVKFQENSAVHIPYGHKLSMQFHYVTNGKATVDETLLGLYLQDVPPEFERLTQAVSTRFQIPAYDNNFELQAEHVFSDEVTLVGVRAHMHFRGKKMKFTVLQTNGEKRDILSVPAYNYGWQPQYELSEIEFLPEGSSVIVTGAFDNSESNPSNPDPTKPVNFGLESWEEMFTGYFTFLRKTAQNVTNSK